LANMLNGRVCERQAMIASGVRIGIIGVDQVMSMMPEYSDMYEAFPGVDWDTRGKGFGATLVRPLTTNSEENLLRYEGDPWTGENILIHELAHTYFEFGVRGVAGGAEYQARLDQAYADAMASGLWANTYAATNSAEYWAEGVQSWFNNNLESFPADGIHNHVNTRAELEAYDPVLAQLISELFSAEPWTPYCDPTYDSWGWVDPTPSNTGSTQCDFRYSYRDPLDCSYEGSVSSNGADEAATYVFVNRTYDEAYKIYWLDYEGNRVFYHSLAPRTQANLSTFSTHPWLVADETDESCVGIYFPETDTTHAIME